MAKKSSMKICARRKCLVVTGFTNPGLLWRWYRRFLLYRIRRQIERLPETVGRLARKYEPAKHTLVIGKQEIDSDDGIGKGHVASLWRGE